METIKQSKAQRTKERLLALAIKEFNKKGFDEVTMRALATKAEMSPGSFYYHFKSKDEIVQAFYQETLTVFIDGAMAIKEKHNSFEKRFIEALKYRIQTFEDHRTLLVALSRSAVDPKSELSPFSEGTKDIRDQTIGAVEALMEGSDIKYDKKYEDYLPTLLWMYMMGMTFYWVFDESPKQQKTYHLVEKLTPMVCRMIRVSALPLTGSINKPILSLLKTLF